MSINERLFAAGFLGEFQEAEARLDKATMLRLLETVDITPRQAAFTVEELLRRQLEKGCKCTLQSDLQESNRFIWIAIIIGTMAIVIVLALIAWISVVGWRASGTGWRAGGWSYGEKNSAGG